ncbi:MAG: rRNA adenine dimethylase [Spirochaetes bacterium]|nr:MAG: rRNA adenine dimethylase [Spirochaetota bacterium]
MKTLLDRYAAKLAAQGLCAEGAPLLAGLDAGLTWNREDPAQRVLAKVVEGLNIACILYARPAEPYFTIMNLLASKHAGEPALRPGDSETRTFLHEFPVVPEFAPGPLIGALRRSRVAIVPGRGVVSSGSVGPEQAFVYFSSVCFSMYVKFFSDHLAAHERGGADPVWTPVVRRALEDYRNFVTARAGERYLLEGPFGAPGEIVRAMDQAGKLTVACRLVDSFFGNISYLSGDTIYISQTGSSLDELPGCIDPCPRDNSSCAGLTASSEFPAHRAVYGRTGARAILHGHPRFSVIMSMACAKKDSCENREHCHTRCGEGRVIGDVPVVPGEVGTGRYGICTTMPPALAGARGAIVYGHGLFVTGERDFNEAFDRLLDIELMCADEYAYRTRTGYTHET